jgi:hypothetical protein
MEKFEKIGLEKNVYNPNLDRRLGQISVPETIYVNEVENVSHRTGKVDRKVRAIPFGSRNLNITKR